MVVVVVVVAVLVVVLVLLVVVLVVVHAVCGVTFKRNLTKLSGDPNIQTFANTDISALPVRCAKSGSA